MPLFRVSPSRHDGCQAKETVLPPRYRLSLVTLLAALLLLIATVTLAQGPTPEPGASPQRDATPALSLPAPLPVEPDLLKAALAHPDQGFDFIVYMKGGVDWKGLGLEDAQGKAAAWPATATARLDRRKAVVNALKTTADTAQADIRSALQKGQASGKVQRVQPFWVVNAVHVQADGATLLALAARPDVAIIRANHSWQLPATELKQEQSSSATQTDDGAPEWNIQRIRADLVWSLMGKDGQGIVVASMDTGVDWQHPDLQRAYRGYDPKGLPNHVGNWFCATDEGYLYPGDGIGHGTHTTGNILGQGGVGVAPGAQWIAVKIFDDRAVTHDAWAHAAFQWLLAPNDDPSLAPDIVNGSWGKPARDSMAYRDDIRALRAAGIVPVFSVGNDGPFSGTVGVPGGYAEVIGVGASDDDDLVASFSSRGPSPFAPVKPDVVAPGVHIRSTFHGGGYAIEDGTSSAAPQVSGVVALLRQADPRLTPDQIADLLRRTARPIGTDPLPNSIAGYGLVDAYAAVSAALGAGELAGRVTRVGDGGPVQGAEVAVTAIASGATIRVPTDVTGHYTVPLQSGAYDVTVRAFGYSDVTARGVVIGDGQRVSRDFTLTLLPVGVVLGRVTDTNGAPRAATVIVEGTPLTTTTQAATGVYSLALPPGVYRLRVEARGFRVGHAEVNVAQAGATVQQDFTLTPAPTILLVDSGGWYYAETRGYISAALDARDYLYDVHVIRSQYDDAPSLTKLKSYDVVLWSSPRDSPRLVGADKTLYNYLRDGGRLILSGQDIGYWDGGGVGIVSDYYRGMLNARYIADQANTATVNGVAQLQGVALTLDGTDSAANQNSPDVVGTVKAEASSTVALYPGSREAGILVNTCAPHRSLYLAFGVEGVQGLAKRADLLDRAIHLMADPTPGQAFVVRSSLMSEVARAGGVITYTLTVRNIGAQADEYTLSVDDARWPVQVLAPATAAPIDTLSLDRCATRDVLVRVTIPPDVGWNGQDTATVRIASRTPSASAPPQVFPLVSRTPAPVLVVDDDQWVDVEGVYTQALQLAAIPHDLWDVGHTSSDGRGSPPATRLALYPVVLWFTSYDFLDTVSPAEEARLAAYLNSGGRLLLSSQDYLYTAGLTRFGADYLGVLGYTEDLTTDHLIGVSGDPISDGLGPFPLEFERVFGTRRYNHTDALQPMGYAAPAFLGDHGLPVALRRDGGGFRTAFFAAPLETLPVDALQAVLKRTLGWLSPLGASALTADHAIVADGDTVSYTIMVRNTGPTRRQAVRVENPLPPHTQLLPDSVVGATVENGQIVWSGSLAPGASHGIGYRVRVDALLRPGTNLTNKARLVDESGLASEIVHVTRVNVPDLSPSVALADREHVQPGDRVNFTVTLRNQGALDAPATVTATLPAGLQLLPETAAASSGATHADGNQVVWTGLVRRAGVPVSLVFSAIVTPEYAGGPLPTAIRIADGYGPPLDRTVTTGATRQLFLPLVVRRSRP